MTRYDPAAPPEDDPVMPRAAKPSSNGERPLSSTLDDLRAAVEASEQVVEVEFVDHELFGPGEHIRLTCSTKMSQAELKRLNFAGLPRHERRKRAPDLTKLDEAQVFALVIARQCHEVAVRCPDDSYKPMPGDFGDPELLATLGAVDAAVAVRRVFGNEDAYLLRAGQELLEACGWGERRPGDPGDDSDPT